MPSHTRSSRLGTTVLGKAFTIVSWLAFMPLGAAALAWPFANLAWEIDLLANLGAQCLLVTLPFVLLWAATRRWTLMCLTLAACASHACAIGMHRELWLPARASAWAFDGTSPATRMPAEGGRGGVLRVVHFNASSYNNPEQMLERVRTCGADIVSWTEISWSMYTTMASKTPLMEEYPYRMLRHYEEGVETAAGYGFILSKLPIEPFPLDGVVDADLQREFLACTLMTSTGTQVGVVAMHPFSPRDEQRWMLGNFVTDAGIDVVSAMRATGVEVIVLADLNSTPSGMRSHRLCSHPAGGRLTRGKPIFEFLGTYPTRWTWPRSIAIDDAFVSDGLDVLSWRLGDPMGSDHYPLYMEIETSK